jgi:hypothetical protein
LLDPLRSVFACRAGGADAGSGNDPNRPRRGLDLQRYYEVRSDSARAFAGVKRRSFPPHAGPANFGMSSRNDGLRERAVGLLNAVGYRGGVDMDFRLDRRDGRYKLLDCNSRLGALFPLFEDDKGIDVARALYLDLTGQTIPDGRQVDGRTFVVEIKNTLARCAYFNRGELSIGASLWSIRDATRVVRGRRSSTVCAYVPTDDRSRLRAPFQAQARARSTWQWRGVPAATRKVARLVFPPREP